MISVERQRKLLQAIGKTLEKEIEVFAVGGTAMMFHGLKDTTLDIDFVFTCDDDRDIFVKAITALGYRPLDSVIVYGSKPNKPHMFTLGDERFDLFDEKVVLFIFSENMRKRASQTHIFDKLRIRIADPQDIIIMKCATDRAKDVDDASKIIKTVSIEWDVLIDEALQQMSLGISQAAFELGEFLEKLKNEYEVDIPDEVLQRLWTIVMKQVEEKRGVGSQ